MKQALWLALLICCPIASGQSCPAGQAQNEAALVGLEKSWAQALEERDRAAVECILAENFEDADINGKLHSRSEVLEHVPSRRGGHNQLSELQPHVLGSFGYVRGLNTVTNAQGKIVAKVRFTDIFIYKDSRWQALAGQETLVKESSEGK